MILLRVQRIKQLGQAESLDNEPTKGKVAQRPGRSPGNERSDPRSRLGCQDRSAGP